MRALLYQNYYNCKVDNCGVDDRGVELMTVKLMTVESITVELMTVELTIVDDCDRRLTKSRLLANYCIFNSYAVSEG